MTRLTLLALALALTLGLAACSRPECPLEDAVDSVIGATAVVNCGDVFADYDDDPALERAQACARWHIDAQIAFRVGWTDGAIEGGHHRTLIGLTEDGGWQTYLVDAYRTAEEEEPPYPYWEKWRCAGLEELEPCGRVLDTLCLACVEPEDIGECGDPP